MSKCEYENEKGMCQLNECMYGDFLVRDDSRFDSGKYCFCDDISKYISKQLIPEDKDENRTD